MTGDDLSEVGASEDQEGDSFAVVDVEALKMRRAKVMRELRLSPRAKALRSKRERAMAGDITEGKALLRNAMNPLSKALQGEKLDDADMVTLSHLHTALAEYLEGVPLGRALCVEREGRGGVKTPPMLQAVIDGLYVQAILAEGPPKNKGDVAAFIKKVAIRRGVSVQTVRKAWEAAGGLKMLNRSGSV